VSKYTLKDAPEHIIRDLIEREYPQDGDVNSRNALYLLRCRHSSSREVVKREVVRGEDSYYDSPPYWIDKAFDAERLYYVGRYSGDVRERILKHCRGKGANFTGIFPPVEIVTIKWIPGSEDTDKRERKLADQIQESSENNGYSAYVYQF
jgi:predicted GIY-YIG superfamily endonuclease